MSFTPEQLALQAHIKAENEKFDASCRASGATFWTLTVDDPAHWAEMGIFNIEQYELAMLKGLFSDIYKDDCGCRPNLSQWTPDEMRQWLERRRNNPPPLDDDIIPDDEELAFLKPYQPPQGLVSLGEIIDVAAIKVS